MPDQAHSGQSYFGDHLIIDGAMGSARKLNNPSLVRKALRELPILLGMKRLSNPKVYWAQPEPGDDKDPTGGWTAVVTIEESHIAIHTFPGRRFAQICVSTCKNDLNVDMVLQYFYKLFDFSPTETAHDLLHRGKNYPSKDLVGPEIAMLDTSPSARRLWRAEWFNITAVLNITEYEPCGDPVNRDTIEPLLMELLLGSFANEGADRDNIPLRIEWEQIPNGVRAYVHVDESYGDDFHNDSETFTSHVFTACERLTATDQFNVGSIETQFILNRPSTNDLTFRSPAGRKQFKRQVMLVAKLQSEDL